MCKARLKPGGVMSLWSPLYESNPATVKSVIATFFKVFPPRHHLEQRRQR